MKGKIVIFSMFILAQWISGCAALVGKKKTTKEEATKEISERKTGEEIYAAIMDIEDLLLREKRAEAVKKYIKGDVFKEWKTGRTFIRAWLKENEERAWDVFSKLSRKEPNFYWAWVGIGKIYDSWKINDQAEENLQKAIKLQPDSPGPYIFLGRHYFHRGEFEKAVEQFDEVIKRYPDDPHAYLEKGKVLFKMEKFTEAESSLQEAVAKGGIFASYRLLSTLYQKLEKKDEALEALKKCVEFYPEHLPSRLELAEILMEQEKYEDALEEYKQTLALKKEDDVDIRLKMAEIHEKLGNVEAQIEEYRTATHLTPENFEIQKKLGMLYLQKDELTGAEDVLKKAYEINNEDVDVILGLSRIYSKWEKYLEAVKFYEEAIALKPELEDIKKELNTLKEKLRISKKPITGKKVIHIFRHIENIVRKIYKEKTEKNPKLRGILKIKTETDSTGEVKKLSFVENSLHEPYIEACVYWNVKNAKFPPEAKVFYYEFRLEMK